MSKVTMEMKKDELVAIATERGVVFKKSWDKRQLVAAINGTGEVVQEELALETQEDVKTVKGAFYAVKAGRETGVFTTWAECEAQVKGFSGAEYKKFETMKEAETFLNQASIQEQMAMIANMANIGRTQMGVATTKEVKNVAPAVQSNKVASTNTTGASKKRVADYTVEELNAYVAERLASGVAIYATNKAETIAIRINAVDNISLVGYTSTARSSVFSVYTKAFINGTFKFVDAKKAAAIHNASIEKAKVEREKDNNRYMFILERSGDFALVDRKEKAIVKPSLTKGVVDAVTNTGFIYKTAQAKAKDKPSLVDRLNAMYKAALK
nr:MAG TPA: viroplasmin [Caudoviricetes sp.]